MASKLSEMTMSLDDAYDIDSAFDSDSTDPLATHSKRNVNRNPETERFTSDSYYKSRRILQCDVCDTLQKSLVRRGAEYHLKAVTLNAANTGQIVRFSLSTYRSPPNTTYQPVCLGISGSNLYLACTKENPNHNPTLVLKVVTDTLNTIPADDPNGILFFRRETRVSVNTFESVKYRGWFISTSTVDNERVNMCQESAVDRIMSFKLN